MVMEPLTPWRVPPEFSLTSWPNTCRSLVPETSDPKKKLPSHLPIFSLLALPSVSSKSISNNANPFSAHQSLLVSSNFYHFTVIISFCWNQQHMSQRTIINFYNFHTNPPTHIRKAVLTCNTASDQILILPGCRTLLWERETAEAGAHLRKHHWKHNFFFFSPKSEECHRSSNISIWHLVGFGFFNTFIHFWRSWPLVQDTRGLIQSPSLLIEAFFPLTSMDLGPSPRKTRFHSSKSDTHSPHSKKTIRGIYDVNLYTVVLFVFCFLKIGSRLSD